ncbi:Galactose oxidase/kelch repeat superfamily protein [Actinidia rufa]|uniref:Galactose oxidase/kelch repeat superfamily protein n=1 Tax=Actinidia rufa TaxID=165716 RepID=A0A7J0ENT9_9ERIC|nr:Galactose oxidase/kelch repeat superfamily protein [Actinidia rufa]
MPGLVCGKKKLAESNMEFSNYLILPGLPDDVAKYCLAWLLVPRTDFPVMGGVSKRWREKREPLGGFGLSGAKTRSPPINAWPCQDWFWGGSSQWKASCNSWLLNDRWNWVSLGDVFQYDSCLNRWSKLANMNVARYDFACAEVNGMVYAVGGYGTDGKSLSSVEVYNPDDDKWTLIESLRRPRWGCFACGFEGKLYVMGGRSSFTIGNSKFVDVYNPNRHSWCEMKNGCVMVTAHAVLGKKLFCMEWRNQRKLAIFNPDDNTWKMVPVPVTGSSKIGFRFGTLDEKLLLFSLENGPGYHTLLYDPNAAPGSEWKTSQIKPSGLCLCSVTIKA